MKDGAVKDFCDAFGIKQETICLSHIYDEDCEGCNILANTTCSARRLSKKPYPSITDAALLQLMCIYNLHYRFDNFQTDEINVEDLKSSILRKAAAALLDDRYLSDKEEYIQKVRDLIVHD